MSHLELQIESTCAVAVGACASVSRSQRVLNAALSSGWPAAAAGAVVGWSLVSALPSAATLWKMFLSLLPVLGEAGDGFQREPHDAKSQTDTH